MDDRQSRLRAAERRLDDALARLETALAAHRGRPSPADGDAAGADPRSPLPESAALGETLAEVRRQNDELKALSRDAAARLDHAIAQIDCLLED
jgi:hypothetical protein